MKTILDEGVPEALADVLTGHDISTVKGERWRGTKSGKLLDLIEGAGFEVLITNDKRMEREQQLKRRPFATLILSVSKWDILRNRFPDVQAALDHAHPGRVQLVECGQFVPSRFRKRGGPQIV